MTDGTTTWSYKYNADGLRTEKTNGTTTYKYVYSGSTLVQMTVDGNTLKFYYDGTTPVSFSWNGGTYYYITNLQGDVVAITNWQGRTVVSYSYDAWGNPISAYDNMFEGLADLNPLRYRGYVYDQECNLYYLQSRYYDPSIGRFINADSYASTGQGVLGNNMFAYCNNNPINFRDQSGSLPVENDELGIHAMAFGGGAELRVGPVPWDENGNLKTSRYNTDIQTVLEAEHFAFYKGKLVIKLPIGKNAASFGIIILGSELNATNGGINTLLHEYGHTVQFDKMGRVDYTRYIAIPSLIGNLIDRAGMLPGDYYSYPWEYQADQYGGVTGRVYEPWAESTCETYFSYTN